MEPGTKIIKLEEEIIESFFGPTITMCRFTKVVPDPPTEIETLDEDELLQ